MTREAKAEHTSHLITAAATGYTGRLFTSPTLYRAALAERGNAHMTGPEYALHRMHRGQAHPSLIVTLIERRARIRRQQRTIGGRRITGLRPGTKRPIAG